MFLIISLFVLLAIISSLYAYFVNENENEFKEIQINNNTFQVEIVDTAISQTKGLSGRESLDEDKGMLFVFKGYTKRSFWMVNMNFSLDMIWIKDGIIVGIEKNAVPLKLDNEKTKFYYSPEPVDMVLEINAGLSDKLNIKTGDKVNGI
ncbi:DUF192 domain-containing protein [Patescibacteria group bacterium]|nr:DUF192 domain-containing protein [Patescibacteria group bacterium]